MVDFAAEFDAGLAYADFLQNYGSEEHRRRWGELHARVQLSAAQRLLIASFEREMKVICLAGAWCGDCVNQCPIFDHFASANGRIGVRYFDRNAHPELAAELKICGGARVPVVVFLSEDGFEVGRYGDRTLAKYRKLVADSLGPACPTGLVPPNTDLLAAVTQEWLDEFERAEWILRTVRSFAAKTRRLTAMPPHDPPPKPPQPTLVERADVPVYNCHVYLSPPDAQGVVRARAASLADVFAEGHGERDALRKVVLKFKETIAGCALRGEPIPWLSEPASPREDEFQRFVPVHF